MNIRDYAAEALSERLFEALRDAHSVSVIVTGMVSPVEIKDASNSAGLWTFKTSKGNTLLVKEDALHGMISKPPIDIGEDEIDLADGFDVKP